MIFPSADVNDVCVVVVFDVVDVDVVAVVSQVRRRLQKNVVTFWLHQKKSLV